jgi:hypothetical protein
VMCHLTLNGLGEQQAITLAGERPRGRDQRTKHRRTADLISSSSVLAVMPGRLMARLGSGRAQVAYQRRSTPDDDFTHSRHFPVGKRAVF